VPCLRISNFTHQFHRHTYSLFLKIAVECNGRRRTKTSRQETPLFQLQLKIFRRAQIVIRCFSKINSTGIEDCSVSGLQCSGENNRFRDYLYDYFGKRDAGKSPKTK
jgi:hypothetical protein